ncbi:MAG TPA: OadG family protein [Caldisericia bacterium]|nr:OadG family protein [Caldisericia bacterium]HRT37287.1 OadG family protein [Caldisericia bacterium]HRU73839.1 OadG family protein [Caldisericia bacterium]
MEINSISELVIFSLLSIGTVFIVLLILYFVLRLFKVIFYHPEKTQLTKPITKAVGEKISIPVSRRDELKKMSIISSAIAYYMESEKRFFKLGESNVMNLWNIKATKSESVSNKIKEKRWKNG